MKKILLFVFICNISYFGVSQDLEPVPETIVQSNINNFNTTIAPIIINDNTKFVSNVLGINANDFVTLCSNVSSVDNVNRIVSLIESAIVSNNILVVDLIKQLPPNVLKLFIYSSKNIDKVNIALVAAINNNIITASNITEFIPPSTFKSLITTIDSTKTVNILGEIIGDINRWQAVLPIIDYDPNPKNFYFPDWKYKCRENLRRTILRKGYNKETLELAENLAKRLQSSE